MPKALSPLPGEKDFESFSGSPRPLGEGLGVRAKTTVLNVALVYLYRHSQYSHSQSTTTPHQTGESVGRLRGDWSLTDYD